jgi:hypothetical protein
MFVMRDLTEATTQTDNVVDERRLNELANRVKPIATNDGHARSGDGMHRWMLPVLGLPKVAALPASGRTFLYTEHSLH